MPSSLWNWGWRTASMRKHVSRTCWNQGPQLPSQYVHLHQPARYSDKCAQPVARTAQRYKASPWSSSEARQSPPTSWSSPRTHDRHYPCLPILCIQAMSIHLLSSTAAILHSYPWCPLRVLSSSRPCRSLSWLSRRRGLPQWLQPLSSIWRGLLVGWAGTLRWGVDIKGDNKALILIFKVVIYIIQ